jgi:type II secretory pathway pseudopilin PulG
VELLVALTITGLLVGLVLKILSGQTRFVAVQSGKEEAQQNVRGALEIISAELRGAIPGGLLAGDPQSLRFMLPRAWGVVCGTPAAGVVDLLLPVSGATGELAVGPGNGIMFNTSEPPGLSASSWAPAVTGTLATVTAAQSLGAPPAGSCTSAMGSEGSLRVLRITSSSAIHTLGPARSVAVLYTVTGYSIATTAGETWLQRSNGMTALGVLTPQPLAGPVVANRFRFTYYAGTPPAEVDVTGNPTLLRTVNMVRVQVVSESRARTSGRAQRDSGAVTVMLRN